MKFKRTFKNGDGLKEPEQRNVSAMTIIASVALMSVFVITGMEIGNVLAEVGKIEGKADRTEVIAQYNKLTTKIDAHKELYDEKLRSIDNKTDYMYNILLQQYGAVRVGGG